MTNAGECKQPALWGGGVSQKVQAAFVEKLTVVSQFECERVMYPHRNGFAVAGGRLELGVAERFLRGGIQARMAAAARNLDIRYAAVRLHGQQQCNGAFFGVIIRYRRVLYRRLA